MDQNALRQLQQAHSLLRKGRPDEALEILLRLADEQAPSGDVQLALGVALLKLNRADEALSPLRQATLLDPRNAEALALLASTQHRLGETEAAEQSLEAARQIDPGHASVRSVESAFARAQSPAAHGIPLVADLGANWLRIGWGLVGAGAIGFALLKVYQPIVPIEAEEGQIPIMVKGGFLSLLTLVLTVFGGINAVVWLIMDLADRRGRISWLVPMLVFAICGLYALPLAGYLLLRRNLRPVS